MFKSFDDLMNRLKGTGYFIDPVMTQVVFLAGKLQKPLLLEGPAGSGKAEVVFWIEQNWLQASITNQGKRHFYIITADAFKDPFKQHHRDLMKRGLRNMALFEAYFEYCFSPKHTVGEQLLDVRRDKRERAAFATASGNGGTEEEDESDDDDREMGMQFRLELTEADGIGRGPDEPES
jgi:hypothetical protein